MPTREEGVTLHTLLQRMNDLERNMISTIRGGRNPRGQARHPQRGERPGGPPGPQQRQQQPQAQAIPRQQTPTRDEQPFMGTNPWVQRLQ